MMNELLDSTVTRDSPGPEMAGELKKHVIKENGGSGETESAHLTVLLIMCISSTFLFRATTEEDGTFLVPPRKLSPAFARQERCQRSLCPVFSCLSTRTHFSRAVQLGKQCPHL